MTQQFSIEPARRMLGLGTMLLLVAGCNDGLGYIRGSVSLDGSDVVQDESTICDVIFAPDSSAGALATGSVDSSGVFQASAGSARGVEPGTYLVGVIVRHVEPPEEGSAYPKIEILSEPKLASPKESGIVVEVEAGSNWFDLEVASALASSK